MQNSSGAVSTYTREDNLLKVQIYFNSMRFTEIKEQAHIGIFEFVSELGKCVQGEIMCHFKCFLKTMTVTDSSAVSH